VKTREIRNAAAIGFVVAILVVPRSYGNGDPVGIAVNVLSTFWWVGPLLLAAAWLLGERRPGNPIARVLGVVGAGWLGFALGVVSIILFIVLLPGRGV
jgi:hypothetical protein